jgi:hypothetical protein
MKTPHTDETCPPELADGIARALLGPEFAETQRNLAEWDRKAADLERKLRDRLAKLQATNPAL